MKKYFTLALACLTVSCAHYSPSHDLQSFRNPSSDTESFNINTDMIGKMIRNGKVGNCDVIMEAVSDNKMRLNLTQQGATFYNSKTKGYVKAPAFSRTVDVDLSKSFGTSTFAMDDYAGTIQLSSGASTILMFDTRTKAVYRLVDFSKTEGEMDCLIATRPN